MPHRQKTTYVDREQFVQQHEKGMTYAAIARQSGWSLETVKKHCQNYRRHGVEALQPRRPGPEVQGALCRFDPLVRWAALRIKKTHPAWGPAVVLDELRQRPSTRLLTLPGISQLGAYFQQFGSRLVKPRRRLQLPPSPETAVTLSSALVFQLDIQERLYLPQLGYFNILNIRAPGWGITVGCYPHQAGKRQWQCKVSQAEIRADCRHTFTQWGLPDVLQTDREKVIVSSSDYPFPSWFTLWLVGLGIEHRLIQRVTQNGCIERCHLTVDKQMLSGANPADWAAFLQHVADELIRLNERLPSRAKACQGQIPLQAHPEALHPQRPYHPQEEDNLFDMQRVDEYLAGGRWVRQASTHGQFKLANRVFNAGRRFENCPVILTFTADTREFILRTAAGDEIKRLSASWINEAAIRDLSVDEIVNVP